MTGENVGDLVNLIDDLVACRSIGKGYDFGAYDSTAKALIEASKGVEAKEIRGKLLSTMDVLAISFPKLNLQDIVKASCLGESDDLFPLVTSREFSRRKSTPFLVEGLFRRGEIGVFYGDSTTGKTFVILDICHSLAQGNAACRHFNVREPLASIYMTNEGTGGLNNRMGAVIHQHDLDEAYDNNVMIADSMPQLFDSGSIRYYIRFLEEMGRRGNIPDVLIIDTLQNATLGANIDSQNSEIGTIFNALKEIAKTFNCAIILVHHTSKADKTTFRGGSSLRGHCDFMIRAEHDLKSDTRTLHYDKIKDGKPFDTLGFELQYHHPSESCFISWVEPTVQKSVKERIVDAVGDGEGLTVNEIAIKVDSPIKNVRNVLNTLLAKGSMTKRTKLSGNQSPNNPFLYSIPSFSQTNAF
jgi:hypothetical protein